MREPSMKALHMSWRVVLPLAVLVVSAPAVSAVAAQSDSPSAPAGLERVQRWAADQEAVLDAKLVGMKAALKLTPDQEKLWAPFESAVRDADRGRMDAIEKRVAASGADEKLSPVDRLDATQKHELAALGHMLMPERARFAMERMRHGWGERE